MTETNNHENKRAEIRGLYIIGLLAFFLVLVLKYDKITFPWGTGNIDIIPIIKISIYMWTAYCVFEILGYSDDVIGKTASLVFHKFAPSFLLFGYLLSGYIISIYFYLDFTSRLFWIFSLFLALVGVYTVKAYVDYQDNNKTKFKIVIKNKLKNLDWELLTFTAFLACLCFVVYYDEKYIVLFWVFGIVSVMLLAFFLSSK